MIYIKQYGAKRSGTNYTRWLLQENFHGVQVLSEVLGWKHGPHPDTIDWSGADWIDASHGPAAQAEKRRLLAMVTDDLRRAAASGELRYVATVKNPYAWWDSYSRFVETKRPDLAMTPEEGVGLWNSLHANWHALSQRPLAAMVRYEDLLLDLDAALDRLAARLRLAKRDEGYRNAEVRMARRSDLSWGMGQTNKPFDPSYYTGKKYLARFDGALMDLFRRRLSAPLVSTLGYEIL